MTEHLVVNVEEQIAKRLRDAGYPEAARQAVVRSQSLPNDTPLGELEPFRLVPVSKEEKVERKEQAAESAWQHLKAERDALLQASDWTQLSDVPAAIQKAWVPYRQKLRDLPAQTKDPAKAAWPEPPK